LTSWHLLGWIIFFSGGCCLMAHHFLPRSQGLCDVVRGFKPQGKQLWLTIDDGPDPVDTPQILDLLDRHQARATFFMIGRKAQAHPELVKEVVARGHSVGNHTFSHPLKDFWIAGRKRTYSEIEMSQQQFQNAGAAARFFRSPAGIKNVFLKAGLARNGLRCIAWTIRSGDVFASEKAEVTNKVLSEAKPGAIILLHEGDAVAPTVRIEAIREILKGLNERGYSCILPPEDSLIC
jgi:peptidoglycan-N-acetylglucosamine deacetylase